MTTNQRRINAKGTAGNGANVPTLVPTGIMSRWTADDADPLYVVQEINYPITANGIRYEESFFESFVAKTAEHPIPGSRSGHELSTMRRPNTDIIMVGGKLEKNGDGTGRVFFKNYIPLEGESGNNAVLRKEAESGMVQFSLVAYTREVIETDANGERIIRVVEAVTGLRNDIVEVPAMEASLSLTAASADGTTERWDGKSGIFDETTGQVVPAGMYDALESDREAKRNAGDADAIDLKTGRPVTFGGGDVVDY